jgi:hypothetical protein
MLSVFSPTSTTEIAMGVSSGSWRPQASGLITSFSSKCPVPRPDFAVRPTACGTDKRMSAFDACGLS